MHARRAISLLVLIAASAAWGCAVRLPERPDTVRAVATFYPLAEFTRRIGGDRVAVRTIVPPGVESHEYEPTPRDVAAVERGRLFIYNGAGFEPWVPRLLPDLPRGVVIVNATEGLPLEMPPWSSGGVDPHVWLDPVLAEAQADRILAGLVRADPAGREAYEAGARGLRADLDALHRRSAKVLASCRRKEFVTSHAAFGYLAARYGLRQIAIAGMAPETEPSPARLRDIIAYVRRTGATTIYTETLVSPRVVEVVARETGAQVRVLNPIEGLTRAELERGMNYLKVMDENLRSLAEGLGCSR